VAEVAVNSAVSSPRPSPEVLAAGSMSKMVPTRIMPPKDRAMTRVAWLACLFRFLCKLPPSLVVSWSAFDSWRNDQSREFFSSGEDDLTQVYWMYAKENRQSTAEKNPPLSVSPIF